MTTPSSYDSLGSSEPLFFAPLSTFLNPLLLPLLPVALGLSALFGSLGIAKTARGFILSLLLTEASP